MTEFKAFEEVHGDQSLELPIRGKTYQVWPPNAAVGLSLNMKLAAGIAQHAGMDLDDDTLREIDIDDENLPDFGRQCLGPVYDEMVADGLDLVQLERAVATAFLAWTVDREAAAIYWNSAGKAVALAEQPTGQRRTETRTRMGADATTPTPRSVTGTSSRAKKRRKGGKGTHSRGASRTTTT